MVYAAHSGSISGALYFYTWCQYVSFSGGSIFQRYPVLYSVPDNAWMYLTPLFYPMEQLPEVMQKGIAILNPMYHYVTQFRTLVLERSLPEAGTLIYGFFLAFLFLFLGIKSFLRNQDKFILYI